MRKQLAICASVFFLISSSLSANAALKPGTSCKKVGQTIISSGKKYTCIKSIKRLVWDKGTEVKTNPIASPSAPPSNSTTPTPKPTPIPTSSPIQVIDEPQIVPAPWIKPNPFRNNIIKPIHSFEELSNRYLDFHYLAWAAFQDAASVKTNNPVDIKVYVGPNSRECSDNAKRAIQLMQNVYSGANLPKRIHLILFDNVDKNWAESKTNEILLGNFAGTNNPGTNPEGIDVVSGDAVLWSENACYLPDPNSLNSGDIAHGYTHSIQRFQFKASYPDWNWEKWGGVPRWLLEGGATFSENITERGGSYYSWKNTGQFHDSQIKAYGLQFFKDFLKYEKSTSTKNSWGPTEVWPNQRSYDVGNLACEVLIAIKGPAIIINLYADFAKTRDFDLSFKNLFGVTWSEVEPVVATAIYKFVQETF